MRFELDDDQALLRSSTRELLENEAALADTRAIMEEVAEGFDKNMYAQLGELGYLGVLLSEEDGGLGAIAFAIIMAEMGRVAFPGPFLEWTVAVRALADCGHAEATQWQAKASGGDALVVLALDEDIRSADPRDAQAVYEDGRVRGTKVFVPFGEHADALLVSTAQGLALVPRPGTGWNASPLETFDHAQRFALVELDNEASLVAEGEAAQAVLDRAQRLGALGASAEMFGLMERSVESAVQYTSEREAFGVPIGSFQALQHRAADMLLKAESTRSAAFRAAWAEENGEPDADYLVSVAKAWAGPAGRFVAGQNIQLHGGVGFTWEYDPHIYLKRIKTREQFHGSNAWHTENALRQSPVI